MVGDNVTFNDRVAVILNVDRAKCIPHGLALVVKHGFAMIPCLKQLVLNAGSILRAGGTSKRIEELSRAPYLLEPRKLQAYTNRYCNYSNT